MSNDFVHLHVHSEYSLLDGACRIDRLCARAVELGMPAIALTDHGSLFGAIDFYKTAKKVGLNPIIGCEMYSTHQGSFTDRSTRTKLFHLELLATNIKGYHNLIKLVSLAHTKGFYYKPRIDNELLKKHSEGLIMLSGCIQGYLSQALLNRQEDKAQKALNGWLDVFTRDRFFIEIQDHGLEDQKIVLPRLITLAKRNNIRLVASNDVHYVNAEDWTAQDALMCIQTGNKLKEEKRMHALQGFYLKSAEEMVKTFREIPEAISNTFFISEQCHVEITPFKNAYPVFNLPPEVPFSDKSEFFYHLCEEGIKERYPQHYSTPEIQKRFQYEFDILKQLGFIDYFLVVWDFVAWARSQGIPVGPGRGSGAGCITAYALKITDIDPLRFGLFFERFLNPERISPPDFDIDFCMRRRDEVIAYVRKKYGEDNVANIITFGTFGAKMIFRDLARVNDFPYEIGDRWAKMVPDDPKITIEQALIKSAELQYEKQTNPDFKNLLKDAEVIEGMVRNTGKHAAGILICDTPISEKIPVTIQENALTTQYPKDPIEALGLLKMDFLGLKTLTVIADAEKFVRELEQPDFDIRKIPFDDQATFQLINAGQTNAIFQLENEGMKQLCQQINITKIEEISDLLALYRPGPMEWIPDYLKGKHNPDDVHYAHPLLEKICRDTYGILVYQEQVMEAAQILAGYTLGGADILRRAMGKKKVEEMQQQRQHFIEGAYKHHKIPETKANELFDILEKFAGYGFNRSHSASYALITYQTAYLKAHFPLAFMASVLSSEQGNAEKLAFFIAECKSMGITVLGPHVNESRETFTPLIAKNSIRFGLGAIKGVGDLAAKAILEEQSRKPFSSLIDFLQRSDLRLINKRVCESLIWSGSFDAFTQDRQALAEYLEQELKSAASWQKDQQTGQTTLFDLLDESSNSKSSSIPSSQSLEKTPSDILFALRREKELLGFYLSGHPLEPYRIFIDAINHFPKDSSSKNHALGSRDSFRLCGIISNITKRFSKKNNRPWAQFQLSAFDRSQTLFIYNDIYESYAFLLKEENLVIIEGQMRKRNNETQFLVQSIRDLTQKMPQLVQSCEIYLSAENNESFLEALLKYTLEYPGKSQITLYFKLNPNKTLKAEINRSLSCKIDPNFFLLLKNFPEILDIQVQVEAPRGLSLDPHALIK